jgi:hypothetical protein
MNSRQGVIPRSFVRQRITYADFLVGRPALSVVPTLTDLPCPAAAVSSTRYSQKISLHCM